jgi:hypothetical protein
MNNIYETYSHTHRAFDLTESINDYQNKIDTALANQNWLDYITITDKQLIQKIYDLTVIPEIDSCRLPGPYTARKNSQILAPLLILLNPKKNVREPLNLLQFYLGFYYSKLALSFLEDGWQSGFCICYNLFPIQSLLHEYQLLDQEQFLFGNVPFLCIGHQEKDLPYNYQKDLGRVIASAKKISSEEYITVG